MVEFKVPEFVNYGQRVTLQVNMAKILNVTFLNQKFIKITKIYLDNYILDNLDNYIVNF